jgi:hypothetical protein
MGKYTKRKIEQTKKVTITLTESEVHVAKSLSKIYTGHENMSGLFRLFIDVYAKQNKEKLIKLENEENI